MAVIKQIWFVRNVRKLFDRLCLVISLFMLGYSCLTIWALGNDTGMSFFASLSKFGELAVIPIFGIILCIIFLIIPNGKKNDKAKKSPSAELQSNCKRELLTVINFITSLILAFFQLNKLSIAKNISGFGIIPVYLTIIGGIIFLIIRIKRFKNL